jgi:hypothetical protein
MFRPRRRIGARLVRSRSQQIFDPDWESTHPGPGRVPDRIGHRARRAGDSDLAHALNAERVYMRVVLFDQDGLERRYVGVNGTWYSARFAFMTRPDRGSSTARSCNANETPQIMPP